MSTWLTGPSIGSDMEAFEAWDTNAGGEPVKRPTCCVPLCDEPMHPGGEGGCFMHEMNAYIDEALESAGREDWPEHDRWMSYLLAMGPSITNIAAVK